MIQRKNFLYNVYLHLVYLNDCHFGRSVIYHILLLWLSWPTYFSLAWCPNSNWSFRNSTSTTLLEFHQYRQLHKSLLTILIFSSKTLSGPTSRNLSDYTRTTLRDPRVKRTPFSFSFYYHTVLMFSESQLCFCQFYHFQSPNSALVIFTVFRVPIPPLSHLLIQSPNSAFAKLGQLTLGDSLTHLFSS